MKPPRSAIAVLLCAGLLGLLGSGIAAPVPPSDPKLGAAYQRLRFESLYPPEAVAFLQEKLQPAPRAVEPLLESVADERAEVRVLVAALLGELGDTKGAAGLWKLVADSSEAVRLAAAGGLVRLREVASSAVPVDLSGLEDNRAQVRELTLSVLRGAKSDNVEQAAIAMLKDRDARVRMEAAKLIGQLGSKSAIPALSEALQDESVLVRTAVAAALGQIGTVAAVDPLKKALADDDWHVRARAVMSLSGFSREPQVATLLADAFVGKLRLDDFALVRDRAADALRTAEDDKSIESLVLAVVSEDCDVRLHAARTIIQGEMTPALPLLMPHVYHTDPQVREKVVEVMGALGGREQLPFVAEATNDPDVGVRLAAVIALRQLQTRGAGGVLLTKLEDPNPHVRAATARLLGDMGDKNNAEHLLPLLKDESNYVRTAAAEALGRLGDRSAVKPLIALLTGEALGEARNSDEGLTIGLKNAFLNSISVMTGSERKRNAIQGLAEFRASEAVDPIIEHGLKDQDPLVRADAAIALGKIKDPRAVGPLESVVKDHYDILASLPQEANEVVINAGQMLPDPKRIEAEKENRVRASVAWALGQIADPAAEAILRKATNDRNSLVRDAANEALARIHERRERLAALAKDQKKPKN